ncbi:phosphoserine aminotransferase [Alicyclobacillus cellulosilyticus]|uniref:Phosphoserine aminotransferase n=1 Tax=Alicyclobacillus cellulosilyticus TaxID=1003997 RepID=A0A917NJX2_9BACL|nr:3-phosphoserine/phosphohydroxythreonine transaminase [Alicyclobacillus cellulosilyticus]GGJ03299.1 phosphoserine aminotransferase [Alicyclobacillus cellulosilyticus]
MTERRRVDNFGAGPAALPLEVLEQAQAEFVVYKDAGMSVMEMSHRSKAYEEIHQRAEALLRELLAVPDDYAVLFLQGGASLQFGMVPLNFLTAGRRASYVLTGHFAEKAYEDAKVVGEVHVAASTKDDGYRRLPSVEELQWDEADAYLHITSNNTIFGTQWRSFPDTGRVPLVADMSSDILSRPIDVAKFGLIYAGAQKNLGPSGVTVVIARQAWLETCRKDIPKMLRYDVHAKNRSLYNTPPTFSIYMMGLVLAWVKAQGGVTEMARRAEEKSARIYGVIDESDGFYLGYADPGSRSRMNVTFRLRTPELEQAFLAAAKDAGFVGLNGHRSVGGCRVSLYNAVTLEATERLAEFMRDFARKNG